MLFILVFHFCRFKLCCLVDDNDVGLNISNNSAPSLAVFCAVLCTLFMVSTGISNPCKELERLGINVTGKGVTACTYQDVCANLNLLSQEA